MKILNLGSEKIIFDDREATLTNYNKEYMELMYKLTGISLWEYDYVYNVKNNWAGGLLLIKGNQYRYFTRGSGRPILTESEKRGTIDNA